MNNQKNMNYLPNDIMSLILNIRTEEMKKDREEKKRLINKEKYTEVMNTFLLSILSFKHDILSDSMGGTALYGGDPFNMDKEECFKKLDRYELHDIECKILSPIEDNEPYNDLNTWIF